MDNIDQDEVKKMYNSMREIWPSDDLWYKYTYSRIYKYLKKSEKKYHFQNTTQIINAGSAGNDYGIIGNHTHIDIAEQHLKNVSNSIIGSIEKIPIGNDVYDVCICVGSVINYCDAALAIHEISRVLKYKGILILDFDQSKSFEFIGTSTYGKNIDIINTFNSGFVDRIWVYSDKFISNILNSCGFKIINKSYYHNVTPLLFRIMKDENRAAKFSFADKVVKYIPYINKVSCNIILTAQLF